MLRRWNGTRPVGTWILFSPEPGYFSAAVDKHVPRLCSTGGCGLVRETHASLSHSINAPWTERFGSRAPPRKQRPRYCSSSSTMGERTCRWWVVIHAWGSAWCRTPSPPHSSRRVRRVAIPAVQAVSTATRPGWGTPPVAAGLQLRCPLIAEGLRPVRSATGCSRTGTLR